LATLLLLTSLDVAATQVLYGKSDDTLAASVSRVEPTLIRVDGHRIRHVFGAEGDFMVRPDKEAGTAYLKPMTDKPGFSAFVSDETGRTWKLLLSVVDGPSDNIVIKAKREAIGNAVGRDLVRNQAIKRMILALDADEEGDVDARTVNEVVPLWQEALFVLVKVVEGPLKGEKYRLTNTSLKRMVIDERELYRRGVVAISIEQPELGPGESTSILVIAEDEE
jgi:conjugal transfer pilus assembly protein TraK